MHFSRILAAAALAAQAWAIDCSAKELLRYNFKSIEGIYTAQASRDTPPSTALLSWTIGVCKNIDKSDTCPENSDVCGTTRIKNGDTEVLAEAIGFNANLQKTYTAFSGEGEGRESGVLVEYKGATWGANLVDARLRFVCDKNGAEAFNITAWDGRVFEGEVRTAAACAMRHEPRAEGELWGWITWGFIFVVLFLSIYIVGGAWFQYSRGNLIDFGLALREVLENFVDLLRGLPAFVREIVEKVTGNSNRGEYSAV